MENKPVSHIVAGLIVGFTAIVLFLTYYFTGISFESNLLSWVPSFVIIAMVIFFVLQYGKANHNNLTFGMLFNYGFKITTIFALLMTLFMISVLYLFPDFKEKMIETLTSQMYNQPQLEESQREVMEKFIEVINNNFHIIIVGGALLSNVFQGIVGALIGAAFAKKNPTTPFDSQA